MSTIDFACPYCERQSSVPASFAGKQGKCPGCQRIIQVPDPAEDAAGGAPTLIEPAPLAPTVVEPAPLVGKAPAEPPAGDLVFDVSPRPRAAGQRPCPACGERLEVGATRCRHCGEVLGPRPADTATIDPRATMMPSGLDYALCVLCSTIGCIVAIVLLLQGYTKRGGIMLAVSVLAGVVWQFIAGVFIAIANGL